MSAIFGLLRRDGQPVAVPQLQLMESALLSLGPDGGGAWAEGHAGMGQRLLRLTPEDLFETQPLRHPASRCTLVNDGRLDNRPELSAEMGIGAAEAQSLPDSAFILHAYLKWGIELGSHLVGSFAFALHDGREDRLILGRSARGGRSLFYHETPEVFAFASAPKALFTLPWIERSLNMERLADFLVSIPSLAGTTLYAGLRSVLPGHLMMVQGKSTRSIRFWELQQKPDIRYSRDEDYVEAFSSLFNRVVQDHLRSATPVGIMMSGGLDSASIAAVAAGKLAALGEHLAAFTEIPRSGLAAPADARYYADETPYVEAMGRRFHNLDVQLVSTDGAFFLDDLHTFFRAAEVPFRNASNRVWLEAIQRRAASQNIRVLLSGLWGNLTMSWDGKHLLPQLIRRGRLVRAVVEARAMASSGLCRSTPRALAAGALPLFPFRLRVAVQRAMHAGTPAEVPWEAFSPIRKQFAEEQHVPARAREAGHNMHFLRVASGRVRTLVQNTFAPDIERGHGAMFGIESRHPAEDQRLADFCLRIPEDQFCRHGVSRWLLRRAMTGILPNEILSHRLRGLQAADWPERFSARRMQMIGDLDSLQQSPLARHVLDLDRVRHSLEIYGPTSTGSGNSNPLLRSVIELGMMTGRFLQWIEAGA